MLAGLFNDFIFACRSLRKSPGFTVASTLLLSIGIGGATLVFSVLDAILLRKLPVSRPWELVRILSIEPNRPPSGDEYPFAVYEQWRSRSTSFTNTFARVDLDVALSNRQGSQPIRAEIVTGDFFTALGVTGALGRLLTREDEWATQGTLPVVLSHDFWTRNFQQDPRVLGRVLHLNGQPFVVAGVAGQGFNGISIDSGPALWVPFIAGRFLTEAGARLHDPRRCCMWEIAGRLRPGLNIEQAQAETGASMQAAWEAATLAMRPRLLTDSDRLWIQNQHLRLDRIDRGASWFRDRFSGGILALMSGAALLLLLACANIAGLFLARVATREPETAVRLALGASAGHIVRQWLAESGLLALLGGAGGLLLTAVCLPFLVDLLPPIRNMRTVLLPVTAHFGLNARVFGFALLMCMTAAILAGLSPGWHASRKGLASSIKSGISNPGRVRLQDLLVGVQVAICTLVLANAGLMVETLRHLRGSHPGFDRDHVVTFSVDTELRQYGMEQTSSLARQLVQAAQELPGVSSAAIAARGLMRGAGLKTTVGLPGSQPAAADGLNTDLNAVSPGYFETMGMHLVAGRAFDQRDRHDLRPAPVVVNQSFVKKFFPADNPIGRRFGTGQDHVIEPQYEIIGVIGDAKYRSLRQEFLPAMFMCFCGTLTLEDPFFQLEVRTRGEPRSVIAAVEGLLNRIDPEMPFREVRTLRDDIEASLWAERVMSRISSVFSVVGALLAGIGLYGLLSYMLARRSREIGIRMALGATPWNIVRLAAARTLGLVLAGMAAGLVASVATGELMRSLLYGISPIEPWSALAALGLVLATAIVATVVPTVRAVYDDPSNSLRAEA